MRDYTKRAIEGKVLYWLKYKDKSGRSSAQHVRELLREIGVKDLTDEVVKAYLYGSFAAISYDITAVIEARGVARKETLKLWRSFCKNNRLTVENWIKEARGDN